jgi:hypothetical protein
MSAENIKDTEEKGTTVDQPTVAVAKRLRSKMI